MRCQNSGSGSTGRARAGSRQHRCQMPEEPTSNDNSGNGMSQRQEVAVQSWGNSYRQRHTHFRGERNRTARRAQVAALDASTGIDVLDGGSVEGGKWYFPRSGRVMSQHESSRDTRCAQHEPRAEEYVRCYAYDSDQGVHDNTLCCRTGMGYRRDKRQRHTQHICARENVL